MDISVFGFKIASSHTEFELTKNLPILDITVYVDERSLNKYTNFLSVISVSAFSSGEILWRIKKAM